MADLFVSYARSDSPVVRKVIRALEQEGLSVWYDAANLEAGQDWAREIEGALKSARAIVAFLSKNSVQSLWVTREIQHALQNKVRLIPVLLPGADWADLPVELRHIHALNLNTFPKATFAQDAAKEIAHAIQRFEREDKSRPIAGAELKSFAKAAAKQSSSVAGNEPSDTAHTLNSAFVVHGHDEGMLQLVCSYLEEIGVRPVVMRDAAASATSLLDKFFEIGSEASYAIVLLSGDDFGASVVQYAEPGVGDRALQYRARQNVILELGYFYGLLGWENVFVLEKTTPKIFPNFERPSDLNGRVFNRFDEAGRWKPNLKKHLAERGFQLRAPG
jgi:predicted nucleotide-binding protein